MTRRVRDLLRAGDDVTLEMRAGTIPVHANGDVWTLTANVPRHRSPSASREALAHMLGLAVADVAANVQPLWVDTGSEQLIIPLASFDAVRRAQGALGPHTTGAGPFRRIAHHRHERHAIRGERSAQREAAATRCAGDVDLRWHPVTLTTPIKP